MSQNTREQWKPIDGFPNYQVSNKGRVKNIKTGRVLKNVIDSHGYYVVNLGKGNMRMVHRLIAQAFLPNPDNLPQINHIDENKLNNDVSNLEWVTASQNIKHSIHQRSCRINQYTLDGELIKQWASAHEIEREFGYAPINILRTCQCKFKQTYGYRWEYAEPSQQRKFNRPVAALTMDGDLICEYKSAADAARSLKICDQSIRNCLNGTYKSTNGLRFFYLD